MSVARRDQNLAVFVSNAAPNAVLGSEVVQFQDANGTAYTTLAAAHAVTDKAFVVYQDKVGTQHRKGPIHKNDIIKATEGLPAVAESQQVDELQIPAIVATGGESYVARLRIMNYGGHISNQDEKYEYAQYTCVAGDTADEIAAGLIASFNLRFAKMPSIVANAALKALTTDTVEVTGVAQAYQRTKFRGRPISFHLTLVEPDALKMDRTATTAANPGRGNYSQVAAMEEAFAGDSSDYRNRTRDFPGDGSPSFSAVEGQTYKSTNIVYNKFSDHNNADVMRQEIMIFHK